MPKHIESLPPATCRIHFDDGAISAIDDLLSLVDRLEHELPGFEFDLTRPVQRPQAYQQATRATVEAIIAAEQADIAVECDQIDPDAAIPSLAALLVAMAKRNGGAV